MVLPCSSCWPCREAGRKPQLCLPSPAMSFDFGAESGEVTGDVPANGLDQRIWESENKKANLIGWLVRLSFNVFRLVGRPRFELGTNGLKANPLTPQRKDRYYSRWKRRRQQSRHHGATFSILVSVQPKLCLYGEASLGIVRMEEIANSSGVSAPIPRDFPETVPGAITNLPFSANQNPPCTSPSPVPVSEG